MLHDMQEILATIRNRRELFSDEFVDWIHKNESVWNAFVYEATAIYRRGFKHYSARTILHVLRHHSAVHERGTQWKLSDHSSPYLARLFDLQYPQMSGMWSFKPCKTAILDVALRSREYSLYPMEEQK
jgi:hypothetical protein